LKVRPVRSIGSPGRIGLARHDEAGRAISRGFGPDSGLGPGVGTSSFPIGRP
jgi:hypothetical protein